ncbi:MAG: TolC family protein [Flavobacteriales bacterium]
MRSIHITCGIVALMALGGCRSLSTQVSIAERPVPRSFNTSVDTTTIARMNWRRYFADTVLVHLIDTALKSNPDVQVALQRIEMARAGMREAKGALFPEIGLSAEGGLTKHGTYTVDGASNEGLEVAPGRILPENEPELFTGLEASWQVDIAGRLRNQRRAAVAHYLASVEGTNFVITELVAGVANAYYDLVALDNEMDIVQRAIVKRKEALDVITMRKETGRADELEVQRFTAELFNVQAREKEVQQRIRETENLLNFLLGRYPQPIARDRAALHAGVPERIASGVPSQLLEDRSDIREAAQRVQASKFSLHAAKAEFYPSLRITAGLGYQAFDPSYLYLTPASLAYNVVGGLAAPLINRSAIQARFNEARAEQVSAMYEYQRTILNGVMEVSNELSNITNLQQMDSLKTRQSEVLTRAIDTSTELYRASRVGYLDVLLAQQSALEAQLELVDTERHLRFAMVNVYKALGGGWR